jgi:hypothetical protein
MPWLGRHLSFRRLRLLVLLGALVVTVAWAAETVQRRRARREWVRPIDVRVVLLSRDGSGSAAAWRRGLDELSARLDADMRRWRGAGPAPFHMHLVGPVRWGGAFPERPPSDGLLDRLWGALDVFRAVRSIERAAGAGGDGRDVSVYVLSENGDDAWNAFAEGMGALNGDVAFVRAASNRALVVPLEVIGHELLHTVGATDKYDPDGHSLAPEGLADPDQVPRYPQNQAEWMAGEVPLGPTAGRPPLDLAEMAVGPATAREIGWTAGEARPGLAVR